MWHVRGEPADLNDDMRCSLTNDMLCDMYYVSVVKLWIWTVSCWVQGHWLRKGGV